MAGGKQCIEFGRNAARTECGVAYALDALSRKTVDLGAVRTGIETAKVFAGRAAELFPRAKKEAQLVAREASRIGKDVRTLKKLSKDKAGKIRKDVEDLRNKARKLFEKGEGICRK